MGYLINHRTGTRFDRSTEIYLRIYKQRRTAEGLTFLQLIQPLLVTL